MTVQDIKKALEICSEDDGCRECPYYDYHRCDKVLLKDALAIITEQNQKYQERQIKQAKIDVLNELKTHSYYDDNYLDGYVFVDNIDELLEEVQNDTK